MVVFTHLRKHGRDLFQLPCWAIATYFSVLKLLFDLKSSLIRMHTLTCRASFTGNVKLTGGAHRCEGRVEYFDKNQWGTLCSEAWDVNDASVACRQLNCGRAHKITTQNEYGLGNGHTWDDQIECGGMESTLAQCTRRPFTDKTCNSTAIAGVICTGQRITHIYTIETHISLSFTIQLFFLHRRFGSPTG